jgi:hypothetical protein
MNEHQAGWAGKYNYREAASINSCEICTYAEEVDEDGKWGVEALLCSAGAEDTGTKFPVKFSSICDLFVSDINEEDSEE